MKSGDERFKSHPFPRHTRECPKTQNSRFSWALIRAFILRNLKLDDIILLVVIVLLTGDHCDDKLLIGILILIFLAALT